MKITGQLRLQHDELLQLAGELASELDPARLGSDEGACRQRWQRLLGRLAVHLAVEDKILYPKLLGHAREDVALLARRFTDEMGALGAAVKGFAARWETDGAIRERPADFVRECRAILDALGRRIARENAELYALADEIGL